MNILLVEPDFPVANKSKNHENFLPIGLLKLYDYYRSVGYNPKLIRGNRDRGEFEDGFDPTQILVTSLFTYWSTHVKETVEHYRTLFPAAKVTVGGIYASLMPDHCKEYTSCDEVHVGIHKESEQYALNNHLSYNELDNPHPIDYQIIHASRGCPRKCHFCGTWRIEPEVTYKRSIKKEICSRRLVFYDNNLFANPFIEDIMNEIIGEREKGNSIRCESQSGFDGRIMLEKPHLAGMAKKAGFINPRIAWDWDLDKSSEINEQVDTLLAAGYRSHEISVFILYNWDIPFEQVEMKRVKCWEWKVQIADCRYRPLTQTYDYYDPTKRQTNNDYYIHPNWTDEQVRQFRRNVRRQNICVRQRVRFFSGDLENKRLDRSTTQYLKSAPKEEVERVVQDAWFPDEVTSGPYQVP